MIYDFWSNYCGLWGRHFFILIFMSEHQSIKSVSITNEGKCCHCWLHWDRVKVEYKEGWFQGDNTFQKMCYKCYSERSWKPLYKKLPGRIRKVRIYKKEWGGERFIDKNWNTFYLLVVKIGKQECIKYYRTWADAPKLWGTEWKMAEIEWEIYGTQWIIKSITVEWHPITL